MTEETNEFDRVKYLKNLLKINQEITEELRKENEQLKKQEEILLDRILTLQKTCGSLTDELEKEKRINEYIKARFVICNTCTDDERKKCLMFTEGLCEGERCEQIVDLESLIDKAAEAGTVR